MNPLTPVLLPPVPVDPQAFDKMTASQWAAVLEAPPQDAARWLTAAARQGHPGSQALLGQWLLDGRGIPRNEESAFAWFLKAAQQGDVMGMNMTGRCFENGWGTAPDPRAAIRWYRHAANKGLDAGLYNLANQYAAGRGVPQDEAQAFALYQQAAGMGHAKSMTKSGRYYEDGVGMPRDVSKAMDCYRRGAKGGDFRGQYAYARLLAQSGDLDQALEWLRRVPLTATPGFLEEVGQVLAGSADPRFAMLSREMVAQATQVDGAIRPRRA